MSHQSIYAITELLEGRASTGIFLLLPFYSCISSSGEFLPLSLAGGSSADSIFTSSPKVEFILSGEQSFLFKSARRTSKKVIVDPQEPTAHEEKWDFRLCQVFREISSSSDHRYVELKPLTMSKLSLLSHPNIPSPFPMLFGRCLWGQGRKTCLLASIHSAL